MQSNNFRDICRSHGLKITPQRELIFRELCKCRNHPTAERLHARVKRRSPNITLDTVNRSLQTFARIGLATIVVGFGGPRRYDANREKHHHVHCRNCNEIRDYRNLKLGSPEVPPQIKREYDDVNATVVISGVCARCRRKK
jgi:Fur family peroxide stress response transcriptional regulator